ncbi:MAG: Asp-tRNA(Asn)/Glu-tRNA(Gln) amidotransferase subunit GatC [Acidobacteria bacterium]|nr:Asp-tRNA(Asn)/Glu-tRNA(Gln) amidotransferase subunit GatC [Acidobacteriota bacterium]
MKITRKDVEHVAALANLELTPDEVERMQKQLDSILAYIDKLNELDTATVAPMAQVLAESGPEAAWRHDAPRPGLTRADALAHAPDPQDPFFKVPKVIER